MIVFLSLLLYITIIRIFFWNLETKRKKILFLVLTGIGIAFVMGVRFPSYQKVSDLKTYYDYYKIIGQLDWSSIFDVFKFEPGYIILNKLLTIIVKWPQFIIIFEAVFCVSTTLYFIYKNSDDLYFSIILYITMGLFSFQLTAFRQSFAIGICLISIEYIKKRKFLPFLLLVLLATSFHKTAILFLVTYYFVNRDIKPIHIIISTLILGSIFIFGDRIIIFGNTLFDTNYYTYNASQNGGASYYLLILLTLFLSLFYKKKNENKVGINLSIIAFSFLILRNISTSIERMALYYSPGAYVALPNSLSLFGQKSKVLLKIIILLFSIVLFIYHILNAEWGLYRFFWQ